MYSQWCESLDGGGSEGSPPLAQGARATRGGRVASALERSFLPLGAKDPLVVHLCHRLSRLESLPEWRATYGRGPAECLLTLTRTLQASLSGRERCLSLGEAHRRRG